VSVSGVDAVKTRNVLMHLSHDPGFPLDFFPVLFAVPRVVGWLAHWRQVSEISDSFDVIDKSYTIDDASRGRRENLATTAGRKLC
jgi:Citrate synthase, C-terminal domain